MIKSAIFDADGTLLDSMKIWEDAGEKYLRRLGLEPEPDLGKILYPMSLEESSIYLKKEYGLAQSPGEIKQAVLDVISDFYYFEVQLKPGVKEFLDCLNKEHIPMVIATTGDRVLLEAALKRLGIRGYFDEIFTCSELHTTKRESYIYQKAAIYLKTASEHTYVFEDVLYALDSAKAAGCKVIAVEEVTSACDKEEIIKISDMYLTDFCDFESFWEFAAK